MQKSLRSKAIHFVSDLSTVLLDPIADKPSKPPPPPPPPPLHPYHEDETEPKMGQLESIIEEEAGDLVTDPIHLPSLRSSLRFWHLQNRMVGRKAYFLGVKVLLELFTKLLESVVYRNQVNRVDSEMKIEDEDDTEFDGLEMRNMQNVKEPMASVELPDVFEPSLLHTKKTRSSLYASLPGIVQGRKWLLLYSTWRHSISLSTLYKRSML
ncbi:hypothetical protein JRO89_XS02G0238800 [Xanthoceras sorbifolium]|uniref:Uncharacterized protein n=1 Tax=Xanthoceras sorbifolium TaxID=99658 RepID=A0ABQ8II73_9ROSI|nr:hypothetical protein JRO89_XS02G0238800 [Xanthoceras sorbifolium]